jgi:ssDNA-binding replication factor A large subunit
MAAFNSNAQTVASKLSIGESYYIDGFKFGPKPGGRENQLTLGNNLNIEKCGRADRVSLEYNITKLSDISNEKIVDVVGIIIEVGDASVQKELAKRVIRIVDQSRFSAKVMLWGDVASQFNARNGDVVAIKCAHVTMFDGAFALSVSRMSYMTVNPEIEECRQLVEWYSDQDSDDDTYPPSIIFMTLEEANEKISRSSEPFYFTFDGHISAIDQERMTYPSCHTCSKKTRECDGSDLWRCDGCLKDMEAPFHRYMLSIQVDDGDAKLYMKAFDDVGIKLMGMTANKLFEFQVTFLLLFAYI